MNTAVANDIKILANTLLTEIEPPNPGCFGRGSLRLWVFSTKFWGESIRPILMGRIDREMIRLSVVSARGGGGILIFSAYVGLDPASTVYPIKYQNSRRSQINMCLNPDKLLPPNPWLKGEVI